MDVRTRTLAAPTRRVGGDGSTAPVAVSVAVDGAGSEGAALAVRLGVVEAKLDALLAAVTGLRMGSLELLDVAEVCAVLKLGRTKVNELIQSGELGMWKLDGERRITRQGLDAYIRRQASGETARTTTRTTTARGTGRTRR